MVAVPAYERFAASMGDSNAWLWAAFDDTLPCTSWYGCYWEEMVRSCPSLEVISNHNLTVPMHMATPFERRWGSVLTAAALLQAWWRPAPALAAQIDASVRQTLGSGSASVAPALPELRCLALHVRRGDSCATPWRHCPALDEYTAAARTLARRLGLDSLFVATEDASVIEQLRATSHGEPWEARVMWQDFDRTPFNLTDSTKRGGTRFWVEQRLRWSHRTDRPLGRKPILEFLVDVEAASHCHALVGTMDSHGSQLMLLRMASRMGVLPPYYSLVSPSCPITAVPRHVAKICTNHTLARDAHSYAEADPSSRRSAAVADLPHCDAHEETKPAKVRPGAR